LAVPVFNQGDDPIACINKAMAFLIAVASLSKFKGGKDKVMLDKAMLAEAQESGQILDEEQLDLDAYDSDCDDVSNAKAVLMANLSNYGSDIISEVPHSEPYHNDMDSQSLHAMQDFKQTPVVDFSDNEITSDINIISYS
ncbi:hypothetical protein Tco_1545506, partial [Tanacetum coccineum]